MKKIVYMDAGASWLKSQSVIESEVGFLSNSYANAGRGVYQRAGEVDKKIFDSRKTVADFINADVNHVVFTSGATDSLNKATMIVKDTLYQSKCPTVAVSDLDHHSARLPWVNLSNKGQCDLIVCPLDDELNIDIDKIPNCDVFVITAMSNVIGVAQNVKEIIKKAKKLNPNVITIVDAAQYVVHEKIDVKDMDCDFLCFSGHKIGADTGVGVLYIKDAEKYNPVVYGGGMVNRVISDDNIVLNNSPLKFEAGTLPLTQIIGLKTAIEELAKYNGNKELISLMYNELSNMNEIKLITRPDSVMISFVPKNLHVLDFGVLLGAYDICVRVGNMCASWIHKKLNIDGSVRISLGPWNTKEEALYVVEKIKDVLKKNE